MKRENTEKLAKQLPSPGPCWSSSSSQVWNSMETHISREASMAGNTATNEDLVQGRDQLIKLLCTIVLKRDQSGRPPHLS
jgi:hypothetical protein